MRFITKSLAAFAAASMIASAAWAAGSGSMTKNAAPNGNSLTRARTAGSGAMTKDAAMPKAKAGSGAMTDEAATTKAGSGTMTKDAAAPKAAAGSMTQSSAETNAMAKPAGAVMNKDRGSH